MSHSKIGWNITYLNGRQTCSYYELILCNVHIFLHVDFPMVSSEMFLFCPGFEKKDLLQIWRSKIILHCDKYIHFQSFFLVYVSVLLFTILYMIVFIRNCDVYICGLFLSQYFMGSKPAYKQNLSHLFIISC